MITSFRHKGLELFYKTGSTKGIQAAHAAKLGRILGLLDVANDPADVNIPGLKLHVLKGDRKGTWSVWVNGNWRVTFRFVGTVPAIKPAAERTRSGLVSVLATPGTVKRAYTRDLIQSFASQCHVRLVGSENLARMAEAYIRGETLADADVKAEIAGCFVERDGRKTDIVVLACTHYPFMANLFRRLAPWPVDWLDPAEAIARQARRLVPALDSIAPGEDVAIFTSGKPDFATRRLMQGFGLRVG